MFHAADSVPSGDIAHMRVLDATSPARSRLRLKVGAQVILTRNMSASEGLVNGTRGVVLRFIGATQQPLVRFANGVERILRREPWPCVVNGRLIGVRQQLPLDLAFALSVHRSQGMTLDAVYVRLDRAFECGQAYVALSRARSLTGLAIVGAIEPGAIRAHPKVVLFYQQMGARPVDAHPRPAVPLVEREAPVKPVPERTRLEGLDAGDGPLGGAPRDRRSLPRRPRPMAVREPEPPLPPSVEEEYDVEAALASLATVLDPVGGGPGRLEAETGVFKDESEAETARRKERRRDRAAFSPGSDGTRSPGQSDGLGRGSPASGHAARPKTMRRTPVSHEREPEARTLFAAGEEGMGI